MVLQQSPCDPATAGVGQPIIDAHACLGSEYPYQLDAPALLARMEAAGVTRALVRPLGAALAVDNRAGNDHLLNAGPRLSALISVNPWHGAAALAELRRCRQAGAAGVYLHPARQGFAPWEPVLRPVMDLIADLAWPVMFQTGTYIQGDVLALAELAREYPRTPVVLAGAGFTDMWFELPGALARVSNLYMDTSLIWSAAVAQVVRELGAARVLFSGGEPRTGYPVVLRSLARWELTPAQRQAILHDNAVDIFGLEGV